MVGLERCCVVFCKNKPGLWMSGGYMKIGSLGEVNVIVPMCNEHYEKAFNVEYLKKVAKGIEK